MNRRQFVYGAGAVMGATLVGCSDWGGQGSGSDVTVFQNGTILPVDEAFSQYEALAISGNQVLAVGSRDDVLAAAGSGANVVDLEGRVVLPGFIEPHMHFALACRAGASRGCRTVPSIPRSTRLWELSAKSTTRP